MREHGVLQNLASLKVKPKLDACDDLEKTGEGYEVKSRPCCLARIIKSHMHISCVTCEDVAKSQNLACLYMYDFEWPHRDSV